MSHHTYATYDAMLTGRCKDRRKLANNTYLERRGDNIAVRLHNTDIVLYRPDGDVVLDTDGWLTVTTKERINRYSPVRVWSVKGRWMLIHEGMEWDDAVPFADGITVNTFSGKITGAAPDADIVAQDNRNRKMRRDIKKFVDSITPEQIVHAWENTGGDCWGCSMRAADGSRPLGASLGCLADHVEERYFHASLAHRAIEAQGYRDPSVIMSMIYYDAVNRHSVSDLLTRNLTKFLRANLLEGVATPGKKGQAADDRQRTRVTTVHPTRLRSRWKTTPSSPPTTASPAPRLLAPRPTARSSCRTSPTTPTAAAGTRGDRPHQMTLSPDGWAWDDDCDPAASSAPYSLRPRDSIRVTHGQRYSGRAHEPTVRTRPAATPPAANHRSRLTKETPGGPRDWRHTSGPPTPARHFHATGEREVVSIVSDPDTASRNSTRRLQEATPTWATDTCRSR